MRILRPDQPINSDALVRCQRTFALRVGMSWPRAQGPYRAMPEHFFVPWDQLIDVATPRFDRIL
jgi:hypothetical protein